jgi:hypothetical protein
MALPIYGYYMNKVYADSSITISTGDFERARRLIGRGTLNCRQAAEVAQAGEALVGVRVVHFGMQQPSCSGLVGVHSRSFLSIPGQEGRCQRL